jgi:spermidine synthase
MPSFAASLLVFLSSAAVLVLELLAARLLIPYVGNTIETYTAIIGVVLAGIALGTWLGGRAADRTAPRRLLAPLLVAGGALSAFTVPLIDVLGVGLRGTGPATAVILSTLGFLAPAAVLSAVTPVVIKLQLDSLERTGSVVGRLSALSTLGGIAGTFLTGFVLVGLFPTRASIRVLAVLIVLGGVIVAVALARTGREQGVRALGRLGADGSAPLLGIAPVVVALLALGVSFATDGPCEEESAYFCIAVRDDPQRASGRVLWLDTLPHSHVDLADPTVLSFTYTAWYGDAIGALAPDGRALHALHIGAGGLTMPRYLRSEHPGSVQLVLELDPLVIDVAERRLGFDPGEDIRIVTGDARRSITALAMDARTAATRSATGATTGTIPPGGFDLVIGDAFGGVAVPWHLTTQEFTADVHALMASDGLYLLNVIDHGPRDFLRAEVATIRTVFAHVAVLERADGRGGNHVVIASDRPLRHDAIEARNRARGRDDVVLHGAALDALVGDARVLTDDRAPVDQLLTPRPASGTR